tara:strand:- start:148 stop:879 length:732 start_codon:yes stop_codon:yes gene_type:complete
MPFYNEEGIGASYAKEVIKSLKQENVVFDYLLIDDCSLDNTYSELNSISNSEANITVHKNKFNLGHGKTVLFGYQYAHKNNYEGVVEIDGDNAGDPNSINELIQYAVDNKLDHCLATRINRPDSIARKIITFVLYINLYIRFRVLTKDSNVGIRYINKKLISKINFLQASELFIPNAYITYLSYKKKLKIGEFPVQMRSNVRENRIGELWGTGNNFKSIIKLLRGSFKCFMEVNLKFKNINHF